MSASFIRLLGVTPFGRFPAPGLYTSRDAADSAAIDLREAGPSRVDFEDVGGDPPAAARTCSSCSARLDVDGRCPFCPGAA